jgi:hypothetical protein
VVVGTARWAIESVDGGEGVNGVGEVGEAGTRVEPREERLGVWGGRWSGSVTLVEEERISP